MDNLKTLVVPGVPDHFFLQEKVPLTKSEIRCLTLSKMQLTARSRVLDVGAGSGGLTVECARLAKEGWVWAVERDPDALKLVRANCDHFSVNNVTLVDGEAPGALQGLQEVDRVVIGGSGGNMAAIIARVNELLVPGGLVVINAILLESLNIALASLQKEGFKEIGYMQVLINHAQPLGGGMALKPLNPVFIIFARKGAGS